LQPQSVLQSLPQSVLQPVLQSLVQLQLLSFLLQLSRPERQLLQPHSSFQGIVTCAWRQPLLPLLQQLLQPQHGQAQQTFVSQADGQGPV